MILLLVGQLLTGLYARETQMRIDEGQTLGYSEAPREVELAVIDVSDPHFDQVVAIPEAALARGGTIQNPTLPFTIKIKRFFPNARLTMRSQDAARAAEPGHDGLWGECRRDRNSAHGEGRRARSERSGAWK